MTPLLYPMNPVPSDLQAAHDEPATFSFTVQFTLDNVGLIYHLKVSTEEKLFSESAFKTDVSPSNYCLNLQTKYQL